MALDVPPLPPPPGPVEAVKAWAQKWLVPPQPPEGWKGWPARVIKFLRSIPAATWLATFVFLAMLVAAVVAWRGFRTGTPHQPWEFRLGWPWIVGAVLLVLTVPVLLHRTIGAWRALPESPFAGVDAEWDRGLAALAREGISLERTPVFLVLGIRGARREGRLLAASGIELRTFDEENRHLAWHIGPKAVYVSLRGVGLASATDRLGAEASSSSRMPSGEEASAEIDAAEDLRWAKERHAALAHFAERLRAARAPSCACNGILAVVSFGGLQEGPVEDERLAHALRSDLLTLQRTTGVRAPVTLLIDGADRHPGFSELVRRLGRDRSLSQRFGHRYQPAAEAVGDDVARLAEHACGAFEDWIHVLFREGRVLERQGNTRLYSLLSHVRLKLTGRLRRLLRNGIAYDPASEPAEDGVPFSGCYFCGLEPDGEHVAFVRSVVRKQLDEQALVEWTSPARRLAKRRRWYLLTAAALDIALAASLVWMLVR